jgi:hypothetical protein
MRVDFCLGIIPRDLPIDVVLLFIDDVSRFVLFLAMALVDIPRADLDTFFHIPFGPHLVKCLYYVFFFSMSYDLRSSRHPLAVHPV